MTKTLRPPKPSLLPEDRTTLHGVQSTCPANPNTPNKSAKYSTILLSHHSYTVMLILVGRQQTQKVLLSPWATSHNALFLQKNRAFDLAVSKDKLLGGCTYPFVPRLFLQGRRGEGILIVGDLIIRT